MSTESTSVTPTIKKKDKFFGMDTEDVALGLGCAAVAGVAILGILKLQDMNVLPKPPIAAGGAGQSSRVTIGPPPEGLAAGVPPVVVNPAQSNGGIVERDPLGPNVNSIPMSFDNDEYVDQERMAKSRSSVDRINAGY